ncbi:MAG: (Fe-S)-binding protein [Syntrophobacterales bacterium]|nr:MAG: (Fe-S)-binding protein [Syntrophobacterales bacterium]
MIGLYFGCTVLLFEGLRNTLEAFFRKAGVTFEPVGIDQCCGIPLLLAGFQKEAGENGKRLVEDISHKGISTLVTSCPHCHRAFSREFPHRFGLSTPFKTLHFTQFAADLIQSGRIRLSKPVDLKLTYHDPCYLGRMGEKIYREPREVLASIPGLKMEEMEHNRDQATCCGGGGLVRAYLPILSSAVAQEKVQCEARPTGVTGVVSSCPFCYFNLKEGAEEVDKGEMEVYDLAELLVRSMEEPRDE